MALSSHGLLHRAQHRGIWKLSATQSPQPQGTVQGRGAMKDWTQEEFSMQITPPRLSGIVVPCLSALGWTLGLGPGPALGLCRCARWGDHHCAELMHFRADAVTCFWKKTVVDWLPFFFPSHQDEQLSLGVSFYTWSLVTLWMEWLIYSKLNVWLCMPQSINKHYLTQSMCSGISLTQQPTSSVPQKPCLCCWDS